METGARAAPSSPSLGEGSRLQEERDEAAAEVKCFSKETLPTTNVKVRQSARLLAHLPTSAARYYLACVLPYSLTCLLTGDGAAQPLRLRTLHATVHRVTLAAPHAVVRQVEGGTHEAPAGIQRAHVQFGLHRREAGGDVRRDQVVGHGAASEEGGGRPQGDAPSLEGGAVRQLLMYLLALSSWRTPLLWD
eukprot:scaffold22047_cov45-Phaeocystis_antarctica.AAC.1